MTSSSNLTWKAYKDGDRYVIGAAEWQTCSSMTQGIIDAYSKDEAARYIRRARITSPERIAEMRQTFYTDSRFEALADAGHFGARW